jgi:hypothetical protein
LDTSFCRDALDDALRKGRPEIFIEIEPGANTGFGLGHTRIGVEVDLLVFEAAPQ